MPGVFTKGDFGEGHFFQLTLGLGEACYDRRKTTTKENSPYITHIHRIKTAVARRPGKVALVGHRTQNLRGGLLRPMIPLLFLTRLKTVSAIKFCEGPLRQMDLGEPVVKLRRIDPVHPCIMLLFLTSSALFCLYPLCRLAAGVALRRVEMIVGVGVGVVVVVTRLILLRPCHRNGRQERV